MSATATSLQQHRVSRSSDKPSTHSSKSINLLSRTAKNGRERSAQRFVAEPSTADANHETSSSAVEPQYARRNWTVINGGNSTRESNNTSSGSTASSVDSGLSQHSIVLSKPANMPSTTGQLADDISSSSSPHFGVVFRSYDQRTFTEKQTCTTSPVSGAQQIVTETRRVQRSKPMQYLYGDNDAVAKHSDALTPLYSQTGIQPIAARVAHKDEDIPPLRYTSTFSLVRTPANRQQSGTTNVGKLHCASSSTTVATINNTNPKTKLTEEIETVETVVRRIPITTTLSRGPLTSSGRRPKHYLHKTSPTTLRQHPDENDGLYAKNGFTSSSASDDDEVHSNRSSQFRRSRRRRRPQEEPPATHNRVATTGISVNNSKLSGLTNKSLESDLKVEPFRRYALPAVPDRRADDNFLDAAITSSSVPPQNAVLLSASSSYITRSLHREDAKSTNTELQINPIQPSAPVARRQSGSTNDVTTADLRPPRHDEPTEVDGANEQEYFFSDNEADQDAKFGSSKRNNSIRSKGIFRSTQQLSAAEQDHQQANDSGKLSRRPSLSGRLWPTTSFSSNVVSQRVHHYSNLSASQRALMQAESTPPVSLQTRPLHSKLRSQSIGQLPSWPPPQSTQHSNIDSSTLSKINQTKNYIKVTSREATPVNNYRHQSGSQLLNAYEHTGSSTPVQNTLPRAEKVHESHCDRPRSMRALQAPLVDNNIKNNIAVLKPIAAVRHHEAARNGFTHVTASVLNPVPSAALKERQRVFEASSNTLPVDTRRTTPMRQPAEQRALLANAHMQNANATVHTAASQMATTNNSGTPVAMTTNHQARAAAPTDFITSSKPDVTTDAGVNREMKEHGERQAKVMVNHRSVTPAARVNTVKNNLSPVQPVVPPALLQSGLTSPSILLPRRRDSIDSGKSSSSGESNIDSHHGENSSSSEVLKTTIVSSDNATGISDVNSRLSLLLTSLTQIRAQLINQPSIECEQTALRQAGRQQTQLAAVLQRKADVVATIRREANIALSAAPSANNDWRYKTLALKLEELDRLWLAVGSYLRQREATIVALIGRQQEFDDAAEACDCALRKYEQQLQAYDALGDTRRDSEKHSETVKQLQDGVESLRRQIDVVQDMSQNIESPAIMSNGHSSEDHDDRLSINDSTFSMTKSLPTIDASRVQQAAFDLRERHDHITLELAQRLAVLDVASSTVKQFEAACAALQRYLDDKDDELDDVEANDVIGRDRDIIGQQVEQIRHFLRDIERCEREELDKLNRMIEDITERGYSTASEQLQLNLNKLSRQLGKLKDRSHMRTEDVELMLDKIRHLHDDAATVLSLIDAAIRKSESSQKKRRFSTSSGESDAAVNAENSDENLKLFLAEHFDPLQAKFTKIRNIAKYLLTSAPAGISTNNVQSDVDMLDRAWNHFTTSIDQWQQTLESNHIAHEKWHDECDDVANKIVELELAVAAARPPVLDTAVLEEQLHGQQFFERMADTARAAFESLCQLTEEIPDFSSTSTSTAAFKNSALELEKRLALVDDQIETRRKLIALTLPLLKKLHSEQMPKFREALSGARQEIDEFVENHQQQNSESVELNTAHTQLHQKILLDVQAPLNALNNTATQLEDLYSDQNSSKSAADSIAVDWSPLRTLVDDCQRQYDQLMRDSESAVALVDCERQTITTFDTDYSTLLQWLEALEEKINSTLANVPSPNIEDEAEPNYEVLLSLIRDDLEDSRKLLEHVTIQLHDMSKDGKAAAESVDGCRKRIEFARQRYVKLSHVIESQLAAAAEQQTLANELREVHRTLSGWFPRAESLMQEITQHQTNDNNAENTEQASTSIEEKRHSLQRDAIDALRAVEAMRATYARLKDIGYHNTEGDADILLQFIIDDEQRVRRLAEANESRA